LKNAENKLKFSSNVQSTPQIQLDNIYALTGVNSEYGSNSIEQEYVPTHHATYKQLSLNNVKGQVGKRLDGGYQMFDNVLKSVRKNLQLDQQHAAVAMIPKTREMKNHREEQNLPGPEVYSMKSA